MIIFMREILMRVIGKIGEIGIQWPKGDEDLNVGQ
jgi:hypothetical protein